MKLKYIVPDMAQTFGNLEFAGENEVEQQRVNGRFVPMTRSYNLYSDIQRADNIIVVLPAKAGEKPSFFSRFSDCQSQRTEIKAVRVFLFPHFKSPVMSLYFMTHD